MSQAGEPFRAGELVERFGGELEGVDSSRSLVRLATLERAAANELSFLASRRYAAAARSTGAGVVIVSRELAGNLPASVGRLVVGDPYGYYARVSGWLAGRGAQPVRPAGIHPAAHVDPAASIHPSASIGAGCVIEADARIAAGVVLGAQVFIGSGASVGAGTIVHPRVVVYHACSIGQRCIVHAGTVIGADGFGFAPGAAGWAKIAQLGRVVVGDDVEIGANCAIDRGAIDDTVIGDGCKLDNLIQIGHNVRIGAHTAIAGCVGIAGSAVIGSRCMIGGGAGILGHLTVCDGAVISAMSLVTRSVREPGLHTGVFPLMGNLQWEHAAAALKQLPRLRDRVRALERDAAAGRHSAHTSDDDARPSS